MGELVNRIWSRPRGEWTRVLRNELPSLADEVVENLRHRIPGFAELLEDSERDKVRWGVEQALLTALDHRRAGEDGAGEQAAASGEEALAEVPPERARRDLFEALIGEVAVSERTLVELSRAARWPLPETVQAIALPTPGEAPQLAAVLGDTLIGAVGDELCLLIPDPDADPGPTADTGAVAAQEGEKDPEREATPAEPGTRAALETALRGRTAAVGHVVPLNDASSSVRWARRLLTLTPARPGPEARVLFVDDHLSMLLLLQDESLVRALAARWLKPLVGLTPRQSERLQMTLLAWLEGGGAPEAAKALKVHPQTVRYRLRQIEKLFGPGLRDPRIRFELEMALRGRRLMAQMDRIRRHASRVSRRTRTGAPPGVRPLGIAREARVNGL
ncbi:helix-turn-helix domain-containing protein [Streptomyces sp. RCU064]|uniref:Helix-turn-helix domain-containing protein n=2 Tax=Streptomyces rugosispiralis TaxID=2967341 RepID=A0ABT1UTL5_9ACTN|nr:PucR family transcriptional regulator [Streptomyces rugosispiralis]MCQ8188361.1 helix-turn-helix domain-containing protein [Streptomyces rugosispiralis]